jgi:adenine deaminase
MQNNTYSLMDLKRKIALAKGQKKADLLITNTRIVNVFSGEIYDSDVAISDGIFVGIGKGYAAQTLYDAKGRFMCPGLIEGHIHTESTLLSIREFCNIVSLHGTSVIVCDPHEIANVFGIGGIDFLLESSLNLPVKVYLLMPSCVPATQMETSGAKITETDISDYIERYPDRIIGLGEMMNYPGVLSEDEDVLSKLLAVGDRPKDGHAPLVSGKSLSAYVIAGLGSDHECSNLDEAREKLRNGMHIMIREGTQEKNLQSLIPVINEFNGFNLSLVSDDIDAFDLNEKGHLDYLIRKAISCGIDPIRAIQMTSINTARYFGLKNQGAIAPGFVADFILLNDLKSFTISKVFLAGKEITKFGISKDKDENKEYSAKYSQPSSSLSSSLSPASSSCLKNSMHIKTLDSPSLFAIPVDLALLPSFCSSSSSSLLLQSIGIIPGQIITENRKIQPTLYYDDKRKITYAVADPKKDLAKLAVIERHHETGNIGLGFVQGLGLSRGAIASSVAHDSHNLVIAGMNDIDMLVIARHIASIGGGLAVADGAEIKASLPLPIAGLMSDQSIESVIEDLKSLDQACLRLGNVVKHPFMLLSFLCLPVIPSLKLTDKGLVDVDGFKFTELFVC